MRINSIQASTYRPMSKMQTVSNISYTGRKGAAKGAAIGGLGMGAIAFLGLASFPAALILGGITAGLSAVIGSEFEDNDADNKNKGDA